MGPRAKKNLVTLINLVDSVVSMSEGGKRKVSEREDASHATFLERVKSIRAARQEKVKVAILLIKPNGTEDRFLFYVRKGSLPLLDGPGPYIDRLAALVVEEDLVVSDQDQGGEISCLRGIRGPSRSYNSNPGELVYVWFTD